MSKKTERTYPTEAEVSEVWQEFHGDTHGGISHGLFVGAMKKVLGPPMTQFEYKEAIDAIYNRIDCAASRLHSLYNRSGWIKTDGEQLKAIVEQCNELEKAIEHARELITQVRKENERDEGNEHGE